MCFYRAFGITTSVIDGKKKFVLITGESLGYNQNDLTNVKLSKNLITSCCINAGLNVSMKQQFKNIDGIIGRCESLIIFHASWWSNIASILCNLNKSEKDRMNYIKDHLSTDIDDVSQLKDILFSIDNTLKELLSPEFISYSNIFAQECNLLLNDVERDFIYSVALKQSYSRISNVLSDIVSRNETDNNIEFVVNCDTIQTLLLSIEPIINDTNIIKSCEIVFESIDVNPVNASMKKQKNDLISFAIEKGYDLILEH